MRSFIKLILPRNDSDAFRTLENFFGETENWNLNWKNNFLPREKTY